MSETSTQYFEFDARLDTTFLASMYEGDASYAAIIFEQFLETLPAQLADIEESFIAENKETFRQQLHKLKPTFSFVGLTNLSTQANVIEKKCFEIDTLTPISSLYKLFKDAVATGIPIVQQEFERLKTLS
jgi:HPt (histidine-containing phosphotransfer) domain-containing protein